MENEENGIDLEQAEKPKMLGMIMNPTEQFKRIRQQPTIWLPLLAVTILTIAGVLMMASGMDFANDPELQDLQLTAEEVALLEGLAKIAFIIAGIFIPIFTILISAVVYFVVAKIVHADVRFKQLFSMSTFVYTISLLSLLINGLAFMLTGNMESDVLFTSLNSVVHAGGALGSFLNMIEIFSIWGMILTAIGLQIVGKFSKGLSWGVVIGIFLILTSISMISAGLSAVAGI